MRRADIEVPNRAGDVDSWSRAACYPRSTFYPLSDGTSTCYRRITKTCFRTCSTRLYRSHAPLLPLHSTHDFEPYGGLLGAPPLQFGRRPPQSNYPPGTVHRPDIRRGVRNPIHQGWYLKVGSTQAAACASKPPTYPERDAPNPNTKL